MESLSISVSEWDINAKYDVDIRILIRKILYDNSLEAIDTESSITIMGANRHPYFKWEIVGKKYVIKNNRLFVRYSVNTTVRK